MIYLLSILISLAEPQVGHSLAFYQIPAPTEVQKVAPNSKPLSLIQVEKLIKNPSSGAEDAAAKDLAIAVELLRRGVDFQITDLVLENLRKIGARAKTEQALKELQRSQAVSGIAHDVKNLQENVQTLIEEFKKFRAQAQIADLPILEPNLKTSVELPPSILDKLERLDLIEKAGIPIQPEVYFEEGRLFFEQGNYDKSVEKLNIAIKLNPSYTRARYLLSVSYFYVRDFRQQLFHAQRVLSEAGDDNKLRGYTLNSFGTASRRLGDLNGSISAFNESKKLLEGVDPLGEARAANNLGLSLLATGDAENARKNFEFALDKYHKVGHKKGEARSHQYLGIYYMRPPHSEKKLDEAFSHSRMAYDLVKDTSDNNLKGEVWSNSCVALYLKKQMDEADQCYEELIKTHPISDSLLAGINQNRGNIRQFKNDFSGSVDFYLNALKLLKGNSNYYDFQAENLIGDRQKADIVYKKNFRLEVLKSLAHSYIKLDQLQNTVPHYKEILEIDAAFAPAYYNLACFYSKQEDRDQALSFLNKGRQYFDKDLIEWSKKDPDLEFIRDDPEFIKIMGGTR